MSNSNNIIVHEYLSSLKEDSELDHLFPILLSVMGFRIIQTPKESKGQSQYGKDIVAIGKDQKGVKYKWYFEVKGYSARNITDGNYFAKDGIRESIIEAKDTAFEDNSVSGFNELPKKIVIVHNGILKSNIRPTFQGFIDREFKKGEFERWDIYHLTDLFSKYLFSEYLLTDSESNRLFKRTLAFLDAPDNDFQDFKELINLLLSRISSANSRASKKFFATLNLLSTIIYHYSKENNNLISAKECSSYLVLQTWAWILKHGFEKRPIVIKQFRKLLKTQHEVLNAYFEKTLSVANTQYGLYAENSNYFEAIGYPMRCFDYLNYLICYYQFCLYAPSFQNITNQPNQLRNSQKDSIIELVENNNGFYRPLIDNHSITLVLLFVFFTQKSDLRRKDIEFLSMFFMQFVQGLVIINLKRNRLPEGYNRIELVSEYIATGVKPEEYTDDSSMLLAVIFELMVLFDDKNLYAELKKQLPEKMSLQIAQPNFKEYNIEQSMFEKHMDSEYYIEHDFQLPGEFNEFKKLVKDKEIIKPNYKTEKAGFPFLMTLSHIYFKNEIFPSVWREIILSA